MDRFQAYRIHTAAGAGGADVVQAGFETLATASAVLSTTVMPFILRGVNLLGISSSSARRAERLRIWERLSRDLKPRHFETLIVREIAFAALPSVFEEYLNGNVTGRTVVRIGH